MAGTSNPSPWTSTPLTSEQTGTPTWQTPLDPLVASAQQCWARSPRGEMDDGVPVREMATGEIDGGTWWFKLKTPGFSNQASGV